MSEYIGKKIVTPKGNFISVRYCILRDGIIVAEVHDGNVFDKIINFLNEDVTK